jgi:sensor histidine kinase YesM
MKTIRYSNQDEAMQLAIVPIYIGLQNWILLGKQYWFNWKTFVIASMLATVIAYGTWLVNNGVGLYLQRWFSHYRQTAIRLVYLFAWCLTVGMLANLLLFGLYNVLHTFAILPTNPERLPWALSFNALIVLTVIVLYEGIRTFESWERALRETEELKKANLQSQFEGLKSQINPHFLFNSLNSLSSLIEEDPAKAEEFVDEMASVYRYLLRSNETQMATLANELEFAHSYFHLLRTRYGTHIQLEEAVDAQYNAHLLPPLTLQLLLENVVKHNVILPENPMRIRIETNPEGCLVVQNNIHRKTSRVLSNQIGLANIATQYRLLGGGEMRVEDTNGFFTVTLPLLQ